MTAPAATPLRVAALQYCAGGSFAETLPRIEPLITAAAGSGAGLVCLPEAATFLAANRRSLDEEAEWEDDSPTLRRLSALAADLGIDLLVGSTFVRRREDDRIVNRSVLIGADGAALASYDKIHMFDANVGDGRRYRESDHFAAGNRLVLAESRGQKLGLTICYDLRFPQLYRACQGWGRHHHGAFGLYISKRKRALACAVARPRHRDRQLCRRAGAVRHACGWPPNIWPRADYIALGGHSCRGADRRCECRRWRE